jgi:hypothetical protein
MGSAITARVSLLQQNARMSKRKENVSFNNQVQGHEHFVLHSHTAKRADQMITLKPPILRMQAIVSTFRDSGMN